jgi:hypothetical protein
MEGERAGRSKENAALHRHKFTRILRVAAYIFSGLFCFVLAEFKNNR